jgi:hypothetical protein
MVSEGAWGLGMAGGGQAVGPSHMPPGQAQVGAKGSRGGGTPGVPQGHPTHPAPTAQTDLPGWFACALLRGRGLLQSLWFYGGMG